jgi:hypothetical protein
MRLVARHGSETPLPDVSNTGAPFDIDVCGDDTF